MPCQNDECGQTRTPCDTAIPETCEALPTATTGSRVLVEDENSCKRGLTAEAVSSILLYDANGEVIWKNGSSTRPIILPNIQSKEGAVSKIIVSDNGTVKALQGTTDAAEPEVLMDDGANFTLTERSKIFGTNKGVLVRNNTTGVAGWVTGAIGTQLIVGSDGTPAFTNPAGTDAITAFKDITGLRIAYTNATSITLTISNAVLEKFDSSGYLALTNTGALVINASAPAGAGSIDAGSLGPSKNYWVYVIYNPTTSTVSGIMSLVSSIPLMPSGYTYYRRVGLVRTTSGSAIPSGYFQSGANVNFGAAARVELKLQSSVSTVQTYGVVSTYYESSSLVRDAVFQLGLWGDLQATAKLTASICNNNTKNPALTDVEVYGGSTLDAEAVNTSYFSSFLATVPPSGTSYWRFNTTIGAGDYAGLYLTGFELVL